MKKFVVCAASLGIVGGGISFFSNGVNKPKSRDSLDNTSRILHAAKQLILNARFPVFVTMDSDGFPHARMIDPLPPDDRFDEIWIGTNRFTRKVGHISSNPRTALIYFDTASLGFAYLSGHCYIHDDPNLKSEKFASGWWMFYPEGPSGPRFVLIQFVPHRIEVVSPLHHIASGLNSWRPASLVRDKQAAAGWSLEPALPESLVAKLRNGLDADGK